MLVGTGGTLLILFFYKLLGGYYFLEGEYVTRNHRARLGYGRRRRRASSADVRRLSAAGRQCASAQNKSPGQSLVGATRRRSR